MASLNRKKQTTNFRNSRSYNNLISALLYCKMQTSKRLSRTYRTYDTVLDLFICTFMHRHILLIFGICLACTGYIYIYINITIRNDIVWWWHLVKASLSMVFHCHTAALGVVGCSNCSVALKANSGPKSPMKPGTVGKSWPMICCSSLIRTHCCDYLVIVLVGLPKMGYI